MTTVPPPMTTAAGTNSIHRRPVVYAALLALFLGALDALVVSAAMPSIVADLGGMDRFAWVYSAYFLARAVALPIFGKLSDLYRTRTIFSAVIIVFTAASLMAGSAADIRWLIAARVFQGLGAGGVFALVYTVLADVSAPADRARTLSLASAVWGIASVLGPTLGGWIVSWASWRWIFWINVPLGLLSLFTIVHFLVETRPPKRGARLDILGITTLSTSLLCLLTVFMTGGRTLAWSSPGLVGLSILALASAGGFWAAEKRAADPILSPEFLRRRGFRTGNGAVFCSSFAIFSLFAYAPLYIQAGLGKSPLQAGTAMLALSLGWSVGSLLLGQFGHRLELRTAALAGAVLLACGCGLTLRFTTDTPLWSCFLVFQLVGIGMGFVTLSTLLVVQNSLEASDLGVSTSSHQLARTLGGTLGVGLCGALVNARIERAFDTIRGALASGLQDGALESLERLLRPGLQAELPAPLRLALQEAVAEGVDSAYRAVVAAAVICLLVCWRLPRTKPGTGGDQSSE